MMVITCEEVLERLRSMSNPANVAGMRRFGINPENTLGISMPALRSMAKEIGKDHTLAQELWASSIHEARILAALVDDPKLVTEAQMERWAADFDSWDVCDQVCGNLFDRTPYAYLKALEWSSREEEFAKRAGFALMAWLSVHDKKARDEQFQIFFPAIIRESMDGRNYVRKAVNWALRNIGKRNRSLNQRAIETAQEIARIDSKTAHWIASDALKELTSPAIRSRLKN